MFFAPRVIKPYKRSEKMTEFQVLIVGGGFTGIYQLHRLRQMGFRVRLFEAGSGLGGIWHWNCYPGARVDSECSIYQFSDPELWKDWNWSEKFPGYREMREYFAHVDKKWDISKDVEFNSRVTSARFDETSRHWCIETDTGNRVHANYVVFCLGFGAKPYIPDIPGLNEFQGECHHTALWPQQDIDMTGKRVGIIGTGASGIQVAQEAAKIASKTTVFQRTPNMFLPMRQQSLTIEDNDSLRESLPEIFESRKHTFGGFSFDFIKKKALAVSDSERNAQYEKLWEKGGFYYWLGTFEDVLFDEAANMTAYIFWRDKIRQMIDNPELWEKLAPMEPLHPFGVKRPSLVQNYFEIFNQSNVELVDLREAPISTVEVEGLSTSEAKYPLDILVLATGFDAVTGGLTNIDIESTNGTNLKEKWANGVSTYLGVSSSGFPNMFFLYGPQAPTGFLNGPSSAEYQGDCLIDCLTYLRENSYTRIEATQESELAWRELNLELVEETLFPQADSWYMGANIPGKCREILNYPGGLPDYLERFNACAANGYEGFVID